MSILNQLFNGEIHPMERYVKQGSEYEKISHRLAEDIERLLSVLGDEEKALLENATSAAMALSQIEGREWFFEGICFGIRLMCETANYESKNFTT